MCVFCKVRLNNFIISKITFICSDVSGDCATSDVCATVVSPTVSSPLADSIVPTSPIKHGECITEEDEQENNESPLSVRESGFSSPTVSDIFFSTFYYRVN